MNETKRTPSASYETKRTLSDGTKYEVGGHPDLAPPAASTGVVGWIRQSLFSSISNSILTILVALLLVLVVPPIYKWFIGSATTFGDSNTTCDIARKIAFVDTKWNRLNVTNPDFGDRSYVSQVNGMGNTVRALIGNVDDTLNTKNEVYPEGFLQLFEETDVNAVGASLDAAAEAQDLTAMGLAVAKFGPLVDWASDYTGACWTLVKKRANFFTFYLYPKNQQWRVWLAWAFLGFAVIALLADKLPSYRARLKFSAAVLGFALVQYALQRAGLWQQLWAPAFWATFPALIALAVVPLLIPGRKEGFYFAMAFPFMAFILLQGFEFPNALDWIVTTQFGENSVFLGLFESWSSAGTAFYEIFTSLASGEIGQAILRLASTIYFLLSPILLMAIFVIRLLVPLLAIWWLFRRISSQSGQSANLSSLIGFLVGMLVIAILFYLCWFNPSEGEGHISLMASGLAGQGLEIVKTTEWGGLMLTMVIGITGIVVSLPIGIVLALGRRSKLRIISIVCVGFIEFIRAVPLITILFMASTMLPLFGPEGWNPDKLMRALVGVALFSSAYMAEVVRGGLQALPKGQYEGAQSMGLSYWKMVYLVVLPQALRIVIPGIVNTFIGLFKDTVLVIIIGMKDLLGAGQAVLNTPQWLGLDYEAYISVALIFFVFCFAMSRYSIWLEDKLKKATTH